MTDNTPKNKKVKYFQRVNASIEQSHPYYFKGHWATVFTRRYKNAVRELTRQQRVVFDVLVDRIGSNNFVRITHSQIAATLDITTNAVSKSLAALCRAGVIYKHHEYVYEIDPGILWFGKRQDYFEPPSNPTPRTHQTVEIYDLGKKVATLHFPRVLTYNQYQRQYGRLKSDKAEEIT
jgi:hypothetical protein